LRGEGKGEGVWLFRVAIHLEQVTSAQ